MPASHSSLNSAPSTSPNQHPSLDPLPTDISISPLAKDSSIRTSRSPMVSHRKSISQDLRGPPSSPRSQRQGSAGMQALQTFYHNPPVANKGSNIFEGRDWKTIEVGEIIDAGEVHFAEIDTSVEDATNVGPYHLAATAYYVLTLLSCSSQQVPRMLFSFEKMHGHAPQSAPLIIPTLTPTSSL